jgi:DeoR family transcriptional regulator, L-fucose operon activator
VKINSRLDRIVDLINEHGFLSVSDISSLCEVSEMTVRRDLDSLSKQNRIQRTYGGAVPLNNKTHPHEVSNLQSDQGTGYYLLTRWMYL